MRKADLNTIKQLLGRFNKLPSDNQRKVLINMERVLREQELLYGKEVCQKEGKHTYGNWYPREYEIVEFDEASWREYVERKRHYVRECTRCGATEYASTLEDAKKKTK